EHHEHDRGAQQRPPNRDGARRQRRHSGRGRRLLRWRVPRHRRVAEALRQAPRLRHAHRGVRHRRRLRWHGRLWPTSGRRDPVRRLYLPRDRPDRVGGGSLTLPLVGRLADAYHDPQPLRRRHLRRADAQPVSGSAVRPRGRLEDGDPVHPLRRQGAAHRRDRGQRPRRLLRAQAHLQRPVRGLLRSPRLALVEAPGVRRAGRLLRHPARQGRRGAARRGGNRARLRHHGPRRPRHRRALGRRRGGDRPADHRTGGHRDDRGVGEEDGALPRAPRSDAHGRLWRRARRARAGALLLPSRSARRARDGLGHALPAQPRMGLLPRARPARARVQENIGGL
ncbi:MAG: Branched-chain alpha-keto acid dehydrogenase, E1 component, beta subunit, partial [uncultured Sphingomonadaceae bacterium]